MYFLFVVDTDLLFNIFIVRGDLEAFIKSVLLYDSNYQFLFVCRLVRTGSFRVRTVHMTIFTINIIAKSIGCMCKSLS